MNLFNLKYNDDVTVISNPHLQRLTHQKVRFDYSCEGKYCEFKDNEGNLWVYLEGNLEIEGYNIGIGTFFSGRTQSYIHRKSTAEEVITKAKEYFSSLVIDAKKNLHPEININNEDCFFYLN